MVVEQYIGEYSVPTDGIEAIPLTKVAYDITKPTKRTSDFSKSIRIPESKEVNKLFEHIFEYNTALQNFNPNKKLSYRLIGDGVTLLKGFCQLIDVKTTDGKRHYIVQAKGALGDLYQAIGSSKLTDLDFSDLDHFWTKNEIEASWTAAIGTGYVYPMINYGDKIDQSRWKVEDFKPAIYLKEYIDRIFEAAGYTYSSNFFDSNFFKRLIIPQSSDIVRLSEDSIRERQFYVRRSPANQTAIDGGQNNDPANQGVIVFNDDSQPTYYNTVSNSYNVTNGRWTVQAGQAGTFAVKAYLKLQFSVTGLVSQTAQLLTSMMTSISSMHYNICVVIERAGGLGVVDVQTIDISQQMANEVWTASYTSPDFEGAFTSADIDFQVGDIVSLRIGSIDLSSGSVFVPFYGGNTSIQHTVKTGSDYGVVMRNTQLLSGDTMIMNDTIHEKTKQKDLLNAIIKRFNMYAEPDELNDKNIYLEPLDDFMTQDKTDISTWLDVSKEQNVKPLGALESGSFLFMDKEDKDNENEAYQSRKEDTYGAKLYDVDNDFLTEEKVIETIFSPCPLWAAVRENDRIISSIAFPRDVGGYAKETANLKLLYWGGEIATKSQWLLTEGSTTHVMPLFYPYAGHLDNPFNPTFDLSWTVPKLLFYDFSGGGRADLVYTDNNCFNVYWSRHIKEISDKDSKILIAYFFLNAHRYNQLSFRKLYFIDGAFWRLLEVTDFDPQNNATTKCKFIKLKEYSSFSGGQETVYGGNGGVFSGGDDFPGYGMMQGIGGVSGYGRANLIFGESVQSGKQSMINSNNVLGASGSQQVFVTGSDGAKILSQNVVVINSPNQEVFRPNEAYVNGVFLEKKLTFDFTLNQVKSLSSQPLRLLSAPLGDEYIKVTRAYIRMKAGTLPLLMTAPLKIQTESPVAELATTSATFFDGLTDKAEILTLEPETLNFGKGVEVSMSSDMEGGDVGTKVSLTIIYQIIKF